MDKKNKKTRTGGDRKTTDNSPKMMIGGSRRLAPVNSTARQLATNEIDNSEMKNNTDFNDSKQQSYLVEALFPKDFKFS